MTVSEKLVRGLLASAMTLALLGGATSAAMAQNPKIVVHATPQDALTARVSYADLNLTTASGVNTLDGRVKLAVRQVCAPANQNGGIATMQAYAYCKSFAWKGAQPQIARAIDRAQDIAANGTSLIPPVAIAIAIP